MKRSEKPELLAPGGSRRAIEAAIDAGADAVYFGTSRFNARMGAENASLDELKDVIALCRAYRVRTYVTMNTALFDRELSDALSAAEQIYLAGADALIVADLGLASLLRRYLPELELHASTQMAGHSTEAARLFAKMGFSRMVCARELSRDAIAALVADSPIETEMFIHGAHCVSHSGQCLLSAMMGGRSGNRGMCAQPCRLSYNGGYPLSLKDMCLGGHIAELCRIGVHSLKIEGRLKSPEYVRGVVSVYRRLIDEARDATGEEIAYLESLFSRGGFTDGYFENKLDSTMLGIRREEDKKASRAAADGDAFTTVKRKIPLSMRFVMRENAPCTLTVSDGVRSGYAEGPVPEAAKTAPLDRERALQNLARLGGTAFEATPERIETDIAAGLMLPVSVLNKLRRAAIDALLAVPERTVTERAPHAPLHGEKTETTRSARFLRPEQITEKARAYFPVRFLPLACFDGTVASGVALPRVITDAEAEDVLARLSAAKAAGAVYALVSNTWHVRYALDAGLVPFADLTVNATNGAVVRQLSEMGFAHVILSPELTLPQLRDVGGAVSAAVYGRLPVMLLEKCVIRETGTKCGDGLCTAHLQDRRGAHLFAVREYPHRNVLYNSVPLYEADRMKCLPREVGGGHFLFTDETPAAVDRVIAAYEDGAPPSGQFRRIQG